MPTLVHLADEKYADKIVANGIKIGKGTRGVYCIPVTPDFYVSHQWLRELRRRGVKIFVGVYFKLNTKELVWFGKYNRGHAQMELGKALAEFRKAEDKLGFEFLVERKIEPKEIQKVKHLPQIVGWRYYPDSHNRETLCTCPMCITPGEINSRKKRKKIEERRSAEK